MGVPSSCPNFSLCGGGIFAQIMSSTRLTLRSGMPCIVAAVSVALRVCLLLLQAAGPLCQKAREEGLLVITAGKGDVVRLVPPLIVTDADIDKCIEILARCAKQVLK